MAEIAHHFFSSETEQSTVSTTPTTAYTLGTLTTELVGGVEYIAVVHALVGAASGSGTNNNRRCAVYDNGVEINESENRHEVNAVGAEVSSNNYGAVLRFTKAASGNVTFEIWNPDAVNVSVTQCFALFFRVSEMTEGSDFLWADVTTDDVNQGDSWADGAAVTIPQGLNQNWLAFGMAFFEIDTIATSIAGLRFEDDTTTRCTTDYESQDLNEIWKRMIAYPITGTAEAKPLTLQYKGNTATTTDIRRTSLFVLRLNQFTDHVTASEGTATIAAVDTWYELEEATGLTASQTGNFIMMGGGVVTSASNGNRVQMALTSQIGMAAETTEAGGTTKLRANPSDGDYHTMLMAKSSFTEGDSLNFDIDVRDEERVLQDTWAQGWVAAFSLELSTTSASHGVATQACPIATGTQIYSRPDLGTVVGGLFFQTYNDTINTDEPGLHISQGATDLTAMQNGISFWTGAENGVATSDNNLGYSSSALIQCPEPPGTTLVDIQGDYNATVADGIEVNWSNVSATARYVSALMFREGIANFDAQVVSVDTGASTAVSLAFEADIVLFISNGIETENTGNGYASQISVYEKSGGNYVHIAAAAVNGDTTPSSVENFRTDAVYGSTNTTNGNPFNGFTLGSFTGSGFTMTRQDSSNSVDFLVVALELSAGYSAQVGSFAAPTSTGVTSVISGLGFTPQVGMFFANNQTAVNTNSAASGTYMVGAIDGASQFTVGGRYEDQDAAVNTDNDSWHNNDATIYMQNDTGTIISEAAFDSFQSNGVDLNFSTATTAIRVGYLVIGQDAAGTSSESDGGTDRGIALGVNRGIG